MCACIVHEVSQEAIGSPRIVVTSGHEPPNMGAETWTWSLWKSSTGSWLLSHPSRPSIMNLTGLLTEIFPNGSILKKIRYYSRQKTLWKGSYKRAWTVTEYNDLLTISTVLLLLPPFSSLLLLGYLPPALQAAAEILFPPGSLWWFPLELNESSPKNRVHFPSERLPHCVIIACGFFSFLQLEHCSLGPRGPH